MSARDDPYLLLRAVNDRTAFSRKLAACWSTATGVLMSALSIRRRPLYRGLRAKAPLYTILLMANQRWLRLQWAHEHRAWQADWSHVVFPDESRFNFTHVAKTARDLCSAQHMQPLSWPAYSPDMSPIEQAWDLAGRRLAHDPRLKAPKTNFACQKCSGEAQGSLVGLLSQR
ncbi:transposable element Tc1 transposase [Trichonephila clavipes]|nr:transposable element Tc1 transposase [Trichonephila clavipes]